MSRVTSLAYSSVSSPEKNRQPLSYFHGEGNVFQHGFASIARSYMDQLQRCFAVCLSVFFHFHLKFEIPAAPVKKCTPRIMPSL